jgi:hypothetical protein
VIEVITCIGEWTVAYRYSELHALNEYVSESTFSENLCEEQF